MKSRIEADLGGELSGKVEPFVQFAVCPDIRIPAMARRERPLATRFTDARSQLRRHPERKPT